MWKSCRQQEKDLREMMYQARKRAEKKKELTMSRFSDPLQSLRITNSGYEVICDSREYNLTEAGQNLMPWAGDTTKMMDKYDGRALLTGVPDWSRIKTTTEETIDPSLLNFERYHILVEAAKHETHETLVLRKAKDEPVPDMKNAPTQRDIDRSQNFKEKDQAPHFKKPQYSEVKFDYGSGASVTETTNGKDHHDPPPPSNAVVLMEETPADREEGVDLIAKQFGIVHYCKLVRKENRAALDEKHKSEAEQLHNSTKLNRRERRKMRDKDRRKKSELGGVPARDAYDPFRGTRDSRSRSRSRSPDRSGRGTGKFITEFTVGAKSERDYSSSSDSYDSSSDEYETSGLIVEPTTEVIKEATELDDDTTAVLRKPGDRWNFARAVDEKFNQPRYKNKQQDTKQTKEKPKEKKAPILPPPGGLPMDIEPQAETPQERLKRKTRQKLKKKMKADKEQLEKKTALQVAERRKREEDLHDYRSGRRSPDKDIYGRALRASSDSRSPSPRSRSTSPKSKRRSPSPRRRSRSGSRDRKRRRSESNDRNGDKRRSPSPKRRRSSRDRSPDRRDRRRSSSLEKRDRRSDSRERRDRRDRSRDRRDRSRSPDRRRDRKRSRSDSRDRRDRRDRSRSRDNSRRDRSRSRDRSRRSPSPKRRRGDSPQRGGGGRRSSRERRNRSPSPNRKRQRSKSRSGSPPSKRQKKEAKKKVLGPQKTKYEKLMDQLSQLEQKRTQNAQK